MPVRIVYGSKSTTTYALLDGGATGDAVSTHLSEKLGMAVRYNNIEVSAFEHSGTKLRGLTDFSIEPLDGTFKVDVNKALVAEILTTENDQPPTQGDIEEHPYLEGTVHFEELDTDHIGIILSARHAWTWET